ncbi:MAG: hypothetical protein KKH02_02380 [Proteobacteria bacterium]|nr:hypothetical protein [Pseudomonadota bacterium]MBU4581257.1 hypothetical protein [Pseudomonadota bacterium]MCG2741281.1 hypothetical protein [Syntrophaceae bacterium]
MTMKEVITLFKYYLQSNHKTRTIESYTLLLDRFNAIHAEKLLDDISPDEIFHFLEDQTKNLAKSTPASICPIESLLQLYHRSLLPEYEKSL